MSGHAHDHGPGAGHVHVHAGTCGGLDHHRGDYTAQQRADLDLVLAFNRRMADAIDEGRDPLETQQFLDPDPLRYMWVDEGQGRIGRIIEDAGAVLDRAPMLAGHERRAGRVLPGSQHASAPSVATAPGRRLVAWLEWVPDRGEILQVLSTDSDLPAHVSGAPADLFRPTAFLADDGTPWVFYGLRGDAAASVWAVTTGSDGAWLPPFQVGDTGEPAFNQEVVALPGGGFELVWQGRVGARFEVLSRRYDGRDWSATTIITEGVEHNVWDPTVAARADGRTAYAWSEYREGAYRVASRERGRDGTLGPCRDLTGGTDYALHPHLAVTADQQLWCAFDVISVAGHGGSGPTRLRPAAELGAEPERISGMRAPGDSVPPELLPEVTASIRVVNLAADGIREAPGELAPRLDVVPSGLPRLVPTADGGLVVGYRVHRQLPLMTYYWEVATQTLGPGGWSAPSTYRHTDGTLQEPSLAATPEGAVLVAQTDARLERALQWSEGFGGRECPYLLEHQGAVIWHGIHGLGTIVAATVPGGGPVPGAQARAATAPLPALVSDDRTEARRWAGAPAERYTTRVGDRDLTLYWGDLHRHSLVSRCTAGDEPTLEDFYRYAWDVCEYDFWAVTDHAENSSDHQWWSIQKIADLFHVPGRFVPLYGFEWTSADSGHQNVIYGDVDRGAPIFSAFAEGTTDPAGLWAGLAAHPDFPAITIPHHPGSAMVHNDWDFHDPRYSRLVEVFQACRGNYEGDGCFRQYSDGTRQGTFMVDGLRRGHRFGLIASSDHGHGASYVGAFAPSLSRTDVFEALHERRTFAATTRDVVIDLRAGDVFMGGEAPPGHPRRFAVHAQGYGELARLDLLRDGDVVHSVLPDLALPAGWLTLRLRVEWGEAAETTHWDGSLEAGAGARVVTTPYWSPEVVAADDGSVVWRAATHSFGEPYGAQRGAVEVTVVGPPDGTLRVRIAGRDAEVRLDELEASPWRVLPGAPGAPGLVRLQPAVGGLSGLGRSRIDLEWTDTEADARTAAFYYARVIQTDGEMAWSSPVFMT